MHSLLNPIPIALKIILTAVIVVFGVLGSLNAYKEYGWGAMLLLGFFTGLLAGMIVDIALYLIWS